MFLLQLQLYVLTIIRVTLRRIHKPLGESPHFVSLNIHTCTVLSKGYKESHFYNFTVIVANEPYTNQLYLQKLTWFLFTSIYFDTTINYFKRFNTDQNTLKQTKFVDKTVKCTPPSLVLIGLHDFLIFSNRTAHAWSVEAGNICSVSVFFVQVGSQISPRRAKKDSNIPSPGRARSVKCHPPCLASPPAGFTLIGALRENGRQEIFVEK